MWNVTFSLFRPWAGMHVVFFHEFHCLIGDLGIKAKISKLNYRMNSLTRPVCEGTDFFGFFAH